MTPKEEADKLMGFYLNITKRELTNDGFFYDIDLAIECALIAVNLHLEELSKMKLIFSDRELHYKHWEEVKQELEKE